MATVERAAAAGTAQTSGSDPLWYKDAVIYQVHVRAYHDLDGDGIGDFAGLTAKLDYLQDLGITAVWLLPFYPSPLLDDGYDIADYTSVNPAYGNLADFKAFLREAHARGLRVITELVLNHTSDQHPWFKRARRAEPGSVQRDYYVWSDTPNKYRDARIIFKDFEASNWSWDPVAKAYYWHRFYFHQPDLNFENPVVHKALLETVDFWLKLGVDGLRLDAVPYLYEREGTSCENLPETHQFLKELRAHVDANFQNRMLLAEANQWPEDAIAYFGNDDECHTAFHFPVMPRLFMAVQMEDRFPVVDIMQQTPPIPPHSQWIVFLRNHDELTLEMVTDEERDYMYRAYARDRKARINLGIRRRLAPLMGNDRRKIEMMNGLLFSLPGTPVIYYGDEIGMGDNIYLGDRNGVRTPMQWSSDRNAGFSRASAQQLFLPTIVESEYHYETVNVETQRNNTHSLFWWMKRVVAVRQLYAAFGRGSIDFLLPSNSKVLAFFRSLEDQHILVVANLSRNVQYVELDLSRFTGHRPMELFGHTYFPTIGAAPYLLTLGPHTFFWFLLEPPATEGGSAAARGPEELALPLEDDWLEMFETRTRSRLERALRSALLSRRWYAGKSRTVQTSRIIDRIPLGAAPHRAALVLLRLEYVEGEPATYALPLGYAEGPKAEQIEAVAPDAVLLRIRSTKREQRGIIYDALIDTEVQTALLHALHTGGEAFDGRNGRLESVTTSAATAQTGETVGPVALTGADQSNSALVYGDQYFLKLFRRVEPGLNPDWEIGRYLTEVVRFEHTPPTLGAIEYHSEAEREEPTTICMLQSNVPGATSAWSYTVDAAARYYEALQTSALGAQAGQEVEVHGSILQLAAGKIDPVALERIGIFLESAQLLGARTGELHLALTANQDDPAFAPEPFTPLYQRALYQSTRKLTRQTMQLLNSRIDALPADVKPLAQRARQGEQTLLKCFRTVVDQRMSAMRIRVHGDFHLGQVLYTGKDFMIIDFEGEPARSISERRLKRSPLHDVAGMIRSFHYAASTALFHALQIASNNPAATELLERGAQFWYMWVAASFLRAYLAAVRGSVFLPGDDATLETLLRASLLEKAVYELAYELNNRPTWVGVPLLGLVQLLETMECAE